MGNVLSNATTSERNVNISESETMSGTNVSHTENKEDGQNAGGSEKGVRTKAKEEEMMEFNKQLTLKREQRKEILARHRAEKEDLEKALQNERASKLEICETNRLLRELLLKNNIEIPEILQSSKEKSEMAQALDDLTDEVNNLKSNNNNLRKELAETNKSLQEAYSDIADLNSQNTESIKQITALKEVVSVSKTMITLREQQLNDLKNKLNEIEQTLGDRETNLLSADLRKEYARQLQNIRTLRGLYEERARLAEVTRQSLARELDEHKILYQAEVKKCKDLNAKVQELEDKVDSLLETVENKNNQVSLCQDETNGLKAEMSVVNKLFSQVLLGYKTKQDLDTLVHRLEENHDLLTQMAEKENGSEMSSALPKMLLELVSQVEDKEKINNDKDSLNEDDNHPEQKDVTQSSPSTTPEEIVENLPKVWKVLMELLSHQNVSHENSAEKITTCYKSVETKSGPVLVPSVSQTYIRLKDLIVEKLGLVKEVNKIKQLNTHLESRLEEQEKKLTLVTNELSKTWHVVGRLRRHHHQLHTHEKILKYELQQKRKLLNELKEELEYCREKWEQAREKNTQSEKDWRKLRAEFTSRKNKTDSPTCNNSGESGYSDEKPSDESSGSNDESEHISKPLIRCKKKLMNSFETILDSSTDRNLAAEREDPASDMLDVADLPLDTPQESEDNHDVILEPIQRNCFQNNEKLSVETEDEIGDIAHDEDCTEFLCPEDGAATQQSFIGNNATTSKENNGLHSQNRIPTTSCSSLTGLNANNEKNLDNTEINSKSTQIVNGDYDQGISGPSTSHGIHSITGKDINTAPVTYEITNANETSKSSKSEPDFKAILENIRKQNERLAKKDERLNNLETNCSEVVENITNTLSIGEAIIEKLDTLHNDRQIELNITVRENHDIDDNSESNKEEATPSTSNEMDHEARFAARDLRLKRLEEQTKCLVSKVNDTTTKGVKINYKLEELHNIYGSESSRAGTPSDDTEDKNNDNDTIED